MVQSCLVKKPFAPLCWWASLSISLFYHFRNLVINVSEHVAAFSSLGFRAVRWVTGSDILSQRLPSLRLVFVRRLALPLIVSLENFLKSWPFVRSCHCGFEPKGLFIEGLHGIYTSQPLPMLVHLFLCIYFKAHAWQGAVNRFYKVLIDQRPPFVECVTTDKLHAESAVGTSRR